MLKGIRLLRIYRIIPLLFGMFTELPALLRLIVAFARGSYRNISRAALLKIAFGFFYLFFFIDLIPDFIPFIGWMDDLAVLAWMIHSVKKEIEAFRRWEAAK